MVLMNVLCRCEGLYKDYRAFLCCKGAPIQELFPQLVKLIHTVAHDCTSNFGICTAQFQFFTTCEDLASINYDSCSSEQCCTSTRKPMSGALIGYCSGWFHLNDIRRRAFGSVNKWHRISRVLDNETAYSIFFVYNGYLYYEYTWCWVEIILFDVTRLQVLCFLDGTLDSYYS